MHFASVLVFLAATSTAAPPAPQSAVKLEQVYTTHERLAGPTALTRLVDARADKVIPLSDGSWFVLQNVVEPPMTRLAYVVEADGTTIPLRAGEWVPPAPFLMQGTMGQIFAATLLGDKKTMAVSFGWTNAGGRNINGIAILDRKNGDWQRRKIIALDGAVRSLAPGPDGGILAAVTRSIGSPAGKLWLNVLLLGTDGRIRKIIPLQANEIPFDASEASEALLQAWLQSLDPNTFVFFDGAQSLDQQYRLRRTGDCTGGVVTRADGVFLYPSYSAPPCYDSEAIGGGHFLVPDALKTWSDVRVTTAFSTGVRSVPIFIFRGRTEHGYETAVTLGDHAWTAPVAWQAVRYLGGQKLEAIEQRGAGDYHRVTVDLH
jgi:hypothetical protein